MPGTRLLCENLAGLEVLDQDGHTFSVSKRARKWLDPASDSYIGTWLEHTASYWEWYGGLERILRDGGSFEIHREPAEDEEYWRVYIAGQYELARLSAEEVARAIRLPQRPTACWTWRARTDGSRRRSAGATRGSVRPFSTCRAARAWAVRSSRRPA